MVLMLKSGFNFRCENTIKPKQVIKGDLSEIVFQHIKAMEDQSEISIQTQISPKNSSKLVGEHPL